MRLSFVSATQVFEFSRAEEWYKSDFTGVIGAHLRRRRARAIQREVTAARAKDAHLGIVGGPCRIDLHNVDTKTPAVAKIQQVVSASAKCSFGVPIQEDVLLTCSG